MHPYREPGDNGPADPVLPEDDITVAMEERIGYAAVRAACEKRKVSVVEIHPMDFHAVAKRLCAKVELNPYGCHIRIHTAAGMIFIVPDPNIAKDAFHLH